MRSSLSLAIVGFAIVGLLSASSARAADNVNRLDKSMPEIRMNGNSLVDVLDALQDMTAINMHVDWQALEAAHVSKDTPVSTRLRDVTLRKALKLILDSAAGADVLTFYWDQGVLEITSKEAADQQMITRVYPIEDLLFTAPDYTDAPEFTLTNIGGGQKGGGGGSGILGGGGGGGAVTEKSGSREERVNAIIQLIEQSVRPEVWRDNGGTSTISYTRGTLIITAPRSVHDLLSSTFR